MPKDESAAIYCPLQRATVDIERCAGCQWRTAAKATCTVSDRRDAFHWRELLRRAAI